MGLQAPIEAGGTTRRIECYLGTENGFVFPLRAGVYNQAAAERNRERLFSQFDRALGVGG